jgi:diaminopimelate epimerase
MEISFAKYQGTGNDFVIIDNREGNINLSNQQVAYLCDRRKGIGADGVMLLGHKEGFDFTMTYYNADGNEGSMCGNGGRCLTQFAHDMGIKKEHYTFDAVDGLHEATIDHHGLVHLKMIDVNEVHHGNGFHTTNTGSPHYIQMVDNVNDMDVYKEGYAIRNSDTFKKEGINVNFVEQQAAQLFVRTFERGVENETYSCGTGVTAAALISCLHKEGKQIVPIETLGGKLSVQLNHTGGGHFKDIWLIGPGTFVFKGTIKLH